MQKVSLSFVAIVAVSAIWTGGCTVGPDSSAISLENLKAQVSSFPTRLAASVGGSSLPTTLAPKRPVQDGVSLGSKATPSAKLHVATARMSEQSGQFAEAERHYQEALAIDSRHADALVGSARLKDNQGQSDQALALYETAAKADPNNASTFNALGLSYAKQRKYRESITALERAIRLEPKTGLYRNNVAMVLVEAGDVDAALSHLKAVQSEAIAHYNVGYILQKKGDSEAAAKHFAQAARKDPSLSAAGAWLAKLQTERPRTAQPRAKIASAKPSQAPRSPMTHTAAPPPSFVKRPPIVLEGPTLERPKQFVQKLPPVPPPLKLSAPSQQTGRAPLPPSTFIGQGVQNGQPAGNRSPLVHPLPPVVYATDLP